MDLDSTSWSKFSISRVFLPDFIEFMNEIFINLIVSLPFSAELLCDFEKDKCNFEVSTDSAEYLWKRYNAKQLVENGIPGKAVTNKV